MKCGPRREGREPVVQPDTFQVQPFFSDSDFFANSAQTEYCPTFVCVLVRHRRDISSFLDNLIVQTITAVRALVCNNGTLLCKIDFNRNLSF